VAISAWVPGFGYRGDLFLPIFFRSLQDLLEYVSPPLPTRLMAGVTVLKYMHDLSDEAVCDRWVENPHFQFFCGEDGEFFAARRSTNEKYHESSRIASPPLLYTSGILASLWGL
jgi:hypothetical protein